MTSLVWIITGIILFGAMTAGAVRLWINRRREKVTSEPYGDAKVSSDED